MSEEKAEMIAAAKWQIERTGEDEIERLYLDLMRLPIDDVMINRLVHFIIRKHDQSRAPKGRGRPAKPERDNYIRFWVRALQEQCGLNEGEACTAIGDAIRPPLSAEGVRSIVRAGDK